MSDRELLYNLLKQTFILLDDGDRQLFGQFDLSPTRYYSLLHIAEKPGLSSSELSDRLLCDKSNVTRIVKGLENTGYIVRKPHESDGRTLRLYLTEKGQSVCTKISAAHQTYNDLRLSCLNEISQGNLLENLSLLNDSLQEELAKPFVSVNGNSNASGENELP
ncbi:MarR family winged helix-turn-helix transcriptional regulator [Candidatus Leptofilum sp.]|uniref:MarR family winged helix-turn-helix transcriptional regulator n=1 Tax=Candidatus Leptofilum sp. TaxID=3241576 RepID=UPI003B597796